MTISAASPTARWAFLASSVAGRTVEVAHADDDRAWTDGRTVFVPDPDDSRRTALEVVVQAGLIRRGSLAPGIVRALRGRPSLARRYLTIEGWAVAATWAAELPSVVSSLGTPPVPPRDPSQSLAAARGMTVSLPLPVPFGMIRPSAVLATADELDADPPGTTTFPPGRWADAGIDSLDDDQESDDPGAIMRLLSSPIGARNPLSRLLSKLLSLGRRPGEGTPGGEIPTGSVRWSGKQRGVIGRVDALVATTPTATPGGSLLYPEWDINTGAYRAGWCAVHELVPTLGPARTPPSDLAVRRALSRVGLGRQRTRRQAAGHDLDLDAVVEAFVARRSGSHVTRDVNIDNRRTRRDLAVLVLLDASGSGADVVAGRTVHRRQLEAGTSLVRELHQLGVRTAFYGFRSHGREHVHLLRFKAFDDNLSARVWRRAGALEPGAYTRLGAAVRHSTHVLLDEAGTQARILLVVSDGFTFDHGYEGRYGEADARRALAEALALGVGPICLSFGAADVNTMTRVFGSASHASIRDPRELLTVLPALCRSSLARADVRRRRAAISDLGLASAVR